MKTNISIVYNAKFVTLWRWVEECFCLGANVGIILQMSVLLMLPVLLHLMLMNHDDDDDDICEYMVPTAYVWVDGNDVWLKDWFLYGQEKLYMSYQQCIHFLQVNLPAYVNTWAIWLH